MCGIAGLILAPDATLPDVRDPLEKMMRAMHLRGPDDRGIHLLPRGRGGLVNTRLAIRDLRLGAFVRDHTMPAFSPSAREAA